MGKQKNEGRQPAPEKQGAAKQTAAGESVRTTSGHAKLVLVAVVAFAVAFGLAWYMFGSRQPGVQEEAKPAARPTKTVTEADVKPFLAAAEEKNFKAMSTIGNELFKPGDAVPNSDLLFAEYAVASFPPYQVYAFYTSNSSEHVYRVLLTMNENHTVESFMAEEMPVVQ